MSILSIFQFGSFTGLTKVQTSGSVTEASNVLIMTTAGASNSWQQTGVRMTTGIKFYPGHEVFGQFQAPAIVATGQSSMVLCLSLTAGISFSNAVAIWIDSPSLGVTGTTIGMAGYDDAVGAVGSPVNLTPGNHYDVRLKYINGGASDTKIGIYWRNSDTVGTIDPASSAWTLLGTSTTTYTPGTTIYLSSQTRDYATVYNVSLNEWLWTDNGSITSSIMDSSDFSSSTGWTAVQSAGTAVFASGICTITKDGTTGYDACGIYRNIGTYINLGHVITFDFSCPNVGASAIYPGYLGTSAALNLGSVAFTCSATVSVGDIYFQEPGATVTDNVPYPVTNNIWYTVKFVINNDGTISCYAKVQGASDATYTFVGTTDSALAGINGFFSSQARFAGSGTNVDNFKWDDGLDAPPAPSSLVATTISKTEIDLTYSDNGTSGNETGIKVERSLTGGGVGFSQIATVAQGIGAYNDTGLTAGTTYYYRVRSYITINSIDYNSAYSSEANATTQSNVVAGGSAASLLVMDDL